MVHALQLDRVDRLGGSSKHTTRGISALINILARCHGAHRDTRAKDIWERGDQAIDKELLMRICFHHPEDEVRQGSDVTLHVPILMLPTGGVSRYCA